MKAFFVGILLILTQVNAVNAEVPRQSFPTGKWQTGFYVEKIKSFHDGYGNTVLVAKVAGGDAALDTGCPNTDRLGLVAYWSGGHMNSTAKAFLSTLLAAKAQRAKVDLLLSGQCNDSHGSRLEGVSIL